MSLTLVEHLLIFTCWIQYSVVLEHLARVAPADLLNRRHGGFVGVGHQEVLIFPAEG